MWVCPGVRDVGVLARPGGRGVSNVVVLCPGVRDVGVLAWPGGRGVSVAVMCSGLRDVYVLRDVSRCEGCVCAGLVR